MALSVSGEESNQSAAEGETLRAALKEFVPAPGPLRLVSADAYTDIFVPVSRRFDIRSAELQLHFVNSISLLRDRSQLRVMLNGVTVGQLPLHPDKAQVDVAIALPAGLLHSGYNHFSFAVAQHYTLECEDPFAPELWTEIDTEKSMLELRGSRLPISAKLSDLNALLGPGLGNPPGHRMLIPKEAAWTTVDAGATVAQASGLHLQYRAPNFHHIAARPADQTVAGDPLEGLDEQGLDGMDGFLVGTRDELKRLLAPKVYARINEAFVGLYPAHADPRNFVLVVSGTTPEQVQRAAASLGYLNFPYADAAESLIGKIEPVHRSHFSDRYPISMGNRYSLRQIGYRTVTAGGLNADAISLELTLPPDFNAPEDTEVELSLNFAYGASMRRDSVLNVHLNDVLQRSVALANPDGAVLHDYRIYVPLRSFSPGKNVLRLTPALVPLVKGRCINLNERNLLFTLFDDSTIMLPSAAHYAAQPDLALFAHTAFPYYGSSDRDAEVPVNVAVMSQDDDSFAAAWMVFGKLAQTADTLLRDARIVKGLTEGNHHLIVLGANDQIDPKLFARAPLSLGNMHHLAYPASRESESVPGSEEDATPVELIPAPLHMQESAGPSAHGLIAAFRSPFAEQRTATLISAGSPTELRKQVENLVQPVVWNHLDGDIALWTDPEEAVATQKADKPFYIGTAPVSDKIRTHLSHSPWFWALGVFVLISAVAWMTQRLLTRRGRSQRIDP